MSRLSAVIRASLSTAVNLETLVLLVARFSAATGTQTSITGSAWFRAGARERERKREVSETQSPRGNVGSACFWLRLSWCRISVSFPALQHSVQRCKYQGADWMSLTHTHQHCRCYRGVMDRTGGALHVEGHLVLRKCSLFTYFYLFIYIFSQYI